MAIIKSLEVYVDGCTKGNPGPSGIGIVFVANRQIAETCEKYLGSPYTNNDAELMAVLEGLSIAPKLCTLKVEILSDSALVINQLNRKWRIGQERHRQYHQEIRQKEAIIGEVIYTQVPRKNRFIRTADSLANKAVNQKLMGYQALKVVK